MTTNLSLEMGKTLSNADLNAILTAAEEVISAIAGENDDVHPSNSTKMCALWDDLNDRHAPPEVVKAVVIELLARRNASKEPVADVVAWNKPGEERKCDIRWRRFDVEPGPLFAAPPLQAATVPDELLSSMEEVIRISDREHEAWAKAKLNIKRFRDCMQESVTNEP